MKTSTPARRVWRIGAISLIVFAALALATYVGLNVAFPPQRLAALVVDQVRAATGRDFRISGGVSFRLWPNIAVVANDVALGNAPWGTRPDMVTVRRAAFQVALRPLMSGRVHILRIDVDDADALLETDRQNRSNWVFDRGPAPAPDAAPSQRPGAAPLELDRLIAANTRITYRDGHTAAARSVLIRSLDLSAQADRMRVSAAAGSGQRTWQIDATTGRYEALVDGRVDWPFDVRVRTDGATLSALGSVGGGAAAGTTRADVSARLDRVDVLAPWLADPAVVPVPIDAKLSLVRTARSVQVQTLQASVAGQRLGGQLTLHTGEAPPRLQAALTAAALDLSSFVGKAAGGARRAAAPAAPGPLFGDAALPRIALPSFPMEVSLAVDRLTLKSGLAPFKLQATLRSTAQRLVVAPLALNIAGGTVNARLEMAAQGNDAPRYDATIDANGLSMEALGAMANAAGRFRGGSARLDARLAFAGDTPRKLVASTSGSLLVSVSKTSLDSTASAIGSNVVVALMEALLPKSPSARSALAIECAVVRLPFKQGVAQIDRSIGLETEQVSIAAAGELNLVAQTVDLNFRTAAKKGVGLDTAKLAQLVRLEGPLQSPAIGVDLGGTAREAASIGAAVATGGLSLVARRMTRDAHDLQACKHAAAPTAPAPPR